MRFTILQSVFSAHISLVGRAVPSRPSHPILANVKLVVEKDHLNLTAFDLSLGISVAVDAEVKETGAVCVPAKMLADIVAKLPPGNVMISVDDNLGMTIKGTKGKYSIRCQKIDEFPELPQVDAETVVTPASVLQSGFARTAQFCSDDISKQVLNGVRVTGSASGLEFAATNGHYLAVGINEAVMFSADAAATVPSVAATELNRLIQSEQDRRKRAKDESLLEVEMLMDASQAVFIVGSSSLTTRLLEGQYPSYRQLMPNKFSKSLTLDRAAFIEALERIQIVASQKNNIVKMSMSPDAIGLSAIAADIGEGSEDLTGEYAGDAMDIAFNAAYLLQALKVISTEQVRIDLNGATSPFIVDPVDGNAKWQCLLMPVQLRE